MSVAQRGLGRKNFGRSPVKKLEGRQQRDSCAEYRESQSSQSGQKYHQGALLILYFLPRKLSFLWLLHSKSTRDEWFFRLPDLIKF